MNMNHYLYQKDYNSSMGTFSFRYAHFQLINTFSVDRPAVTNFTKKKHITVQCPCKRY